jgi:hypothetical protein
MMTKTLAAAALALLAFAGSASAQSWRTEHLGCRDVNFRVDRDAIHVGRHEGTFRAIRLKVRGAPIEMFDLKVTYGNGRWDDLAVRQIIPAGGETRWIDLRGRDRFIRRIDMVYRSIPTFMGKAAVCAEGLR